MKMEAPPPTVDQAKEKISGLKDAHVCVCVYVYMGICISHKKKKSIKS